jgi:hypothetical protein
LINGIKDGDLSYYPPRARWYGRAWSSACRPLRRSVHLEKFLPPGKLSTGGLVLSVLVPGYAFFVQRREALGLVFLLGYLAAVLTFLAGLGYPAANVGYGLLISIHATSIMFLEGLWLKESSFGVKVGLGLCTLVAVWGLMYAPLVGYAERHWMLPLRLGERVLVINPRTAVKSIKRGDWLAYRIRSDHAPGDYGGQAVYLREGIGVDPVIGLPGDHVEFTPEAVLVNGRPAPLAPHMPTQGGLVVPEKVWFIWPNLAKSGGGRVAEANISATMQQAAMVTQQQILGRPYKAWFGRQQWP